MGVDQSTRCVKTLGQGDELQFDLAGESCKEDEMMHNFGMACRCCACIMGAIEMGWQG